MESSRNVVSTIGAQASPKMGGRNQVSGRVIVPVGMSYPLQKQKISPLVKFDELYAHIY